MLPSTREQMRAAYRYIFMFQPDVCLRIWTGVASRAYVIPNIVLYLYVTMLAWLHSFARERSPARLAEVKIDSRGQYEPPGAVFRLAADGWI